MRRMLCGAALAAALVGLVGCGDSGPKIVPVSGTVFIDGQPLTYGHIQVVPTGWRPASGRIGADGRFTLTTTEPNDGCAVGTHAVAILAGESITPENTKWHAPQRYADAKSSNLSVTITGPTTDLKIELTSGGKVSAKDAAKERGTENEGFQFSK